MSHKDLPYIYVESTTVHIPNDKKPKTSCFVRITFCSFCIKSFSCYFHEYSISHNFEKIIVPFSHWGKAEDLKGITKEPFVILNNFTLELKRIYYYFIIFVFVIPSFLQLLVSGFWHPIIIFFHERHVVSLL